MISIQILFYQLLMIILQLLGRQCIQRMENSGKHIWLKKWHPCKRMILGICRRRNPIGNKWVFKKKLKVEGKVEKYKVRLVEKGYSRVNKIDFGEKIYRVSKLTFIRFLLCIDVSFDFEVE
jgi:hypothetical protein